VPALPTRSPMARARSEIDTFTIPEGRRRRVYRPGRHDGATTRVVNSQCFMARQRALSTHNASGTGAADETLPRARSLVPRANARGFRDENLPVGLERLPAG
jgi:hypothetical protein